MTYNTYMSVSGQKENDVESQSEIDENSALVKKKHPLNQKLPYPKRVIFLICNAFCERFNYYGIRAILISFMMTKLNLDKDTSTVYFHSFTMALYFFCIFGGILSDVWLGKFKTILLMLIVYTIGSLSITIGSLPSSSANGGAPLYIGMALIAIGNGGTKPCMQAMGGDQFQLPEQASKMSTYFSIFYFASTAGILLTTSITPNLRTYFHCFGENDCYPLAFAVPTVVMAISIVIFAIGKSSYTEKPSSSNTLVEVSRCIMNALSIKRRAQNSGRREHFLDYSVEKYGQQLVNETKCLLNILVLFMPLPIFWSLFDQMYSRWPTQAQKMDGNLGFYTILPDQIQALSPLSLIVMIPLFNYCFYPILSKFGFKRPLQKLAAGGCLAAVSFLISANIEQRIENEPINSVSMLWQLPQYIVMTAAEIMFSITGLSFSYEQAPDSMKSVVQAFWLLTIAIGNAVVAIIATLKLFESQTYNFLLFAILMFLDMLIFIVLAKRYKRVSI